MAINCPSCLSRCEASARYCPSCGQALSAPDALTADGPAPLRLQASAARGSSSADALTMAPPSSGRPVGSGLSVLDDARFVPGTLLAGRYRVVGLLGRGGMGEVYRADDLTLGQPVALKFLPSGLSTDPDRLARFRAEVSIARQVSHPNVCRVYDIGEAEGLTFLSMEYIDGEDLGTLLRRIGRLPQDKGVEIARQICAGLAAAHDRGIVHRDLKPANVMIDGRGHARLADFGLAEAGASDTGRARGSGPAAGTPAYMAPEQFVGQPASVQSDLYALGLVLYEIFTGKPAFSGATVGELATMHRERTPSSVTSLVSDLDPAVERTIQRCLEKDPALRPASALAVSASLPGGDPLAAAIARGETPSPELVAAAGSTGLVTPAFALGGLALALIALVVVVLITGVLHPVLLSPLAKSPDVLRNDASLIVRAFGDTHTPADTSSGFAQSFYFAQLRTEPAATRRAHLRLGQPAAFVFWYRQSAHAALSADNFGSNSRVSPNSPPMTEPGMIAVDLDTQGRLLQFLAVPSQDDRGAAPAPAPDWTVAFAKAGLDPARFVPVTPRWVPPVYADTRAAWDGVYPERPDIALHVEAAAAHGQLVYFEMLGPWRQPIRDVPVQSASRWFQVVLVPLVFLSLLVTAFLLTVRNLHLGRGDRRGAFRIAGFVVAMVGSAGVLGSDLQPTPGGVFGVALLAAAQALLIGVCAWIGYIALEPYVRRRWPQTLIGWSRLIGGRWRDPLVGRDVLAGVLVALALQVPSFLLDLAGATDTTTSYPVWMLDGLRFTAAWICTQAASLVLVGIGMLFAFLLLTVVVRRGWIAGAIVVAFLAASAVAQGANPLLDAATAVIAVGMLVVCMVRLGLLATIVVMLVENLTSVAPFTFDPSRWYAADSYLVIGVIVALAVFGAWTSANLRPAVKRMMGD